MKNTHFVAMTLILFTFLAGCGQVWERNEGSESNQVISLDDTQEPEEMDAKPDIGAGYNKLSNTYLPSCFKKLNTSAPTEIEETLLTYKDDLNEESLRELLDIEISAKIPINAIITLNPKLIFSRDASSSALSHSTTYIAYAKLGQKQIAFGNENKLVLKPQFRQYFDEEGYLKNVYDFVRLCGDELIHTQQLGSKLLLTTKLSFQSKADKLSFEADMGVSPTVAPNWVFNGKIKTLNEQLRKRLRINFYGIQLGGQPERLLNAIKANACTLDDIEKCQKLLDNLHNYVSEDYSKQLIATSIERWTIEQIESLPYFLSDIYDESGKQLKFDAMASGPILEKLDKLKIVGQNHAITQQKNFQTAEMMKQKPYLATDEQATLNEISTISSENIQKIKSFGQDCYKDLNFCVSLNAQETFAKIIKLYDTSLLDANLGVLISKVYASTKSTSFFDSRVSEDFVLLQPDLRTGLYSSYYIKFKNLKNYVIKSDKVSVDINCNQFLWFSETLISGAFQYYEILQPQMEINYKNKCGDTTPLYVASPKGFSALLAPDTQFIVELWGRP